MTSKSPTAASRLAEFEARVEDIRKDLRSRDSRVVTNALSKTEILIQNGSAWLSSRVTPDLLRELCALIMRGDRGITAPTMNLILEISGTEMGCNLLLKLPHPAKFAAAATQVEVAAIISDVSGKPLPIQDNAVLVYKQVLTIILSLLNTTTGIPRGRAIVTTSIRTILKFAQVEEGQKQIQSLPSDAVITLFDRLLQLGSAAKVDPDLVCAAGELAEHVSGAFSEELTTQPNYSKLLQTITAQVKAADPAMAESSNKKTEEQEEIANSLCYAAEDALKILRKFLSTSTLRMRLLESHSHLPSLFNACWSVLDADFCHEAATVLALLTTPEDAGKWLLRQPPRLAHDMDIRCRLYRYKIPELIAEYLREEHPLCARRAAMRMLINVFDAGAQEEGIFNPASSGGMTKMILETVSKAALAPEVGIALDACAVLSSMLSPLAHRADISRQQVMESNGSSLFVKMMSRLLKCTDVDQLPLYAEVLCIMLCTPEFAKAYMRFLNPAPGKPAGWFSKAVPSQEEEMSAQLRQALLKALSQSGKRVCAAAAEATASIAVTSQGCLWLMSGTGQSDPGCVLMALLSALTPPPTPPAPSPSTSEPAPSSGAAEGTSVPEGMLEDPPVSPPPVLQRRRSIAMSVGDEQPDLSALLEGTTMTEENPLLALGAASQGPAAEVPDSTATTSVAEDTEEAVSSEAKAEKTHEVAVTSPETNKPKFSPKFLLGSADRARSPPSKQTSGVRSSSPPPALPVEKEKEKEVEVPSVTSSRDEEDANEAPEEAAEKATCSAEFLNRSGWWKGRLSNKLGCDGVVATAFAAFISDEAVRNILLKDERGTSARLLLSAITNLLTQTPADPALVDGLASCIEMPSGLRLLAHIGEKGKNDLVCKLEAHAISPTTTETRANKATHLFRTLKNATFRALK